MQQLDRTLIELAERGEAIGADLMLERLQRRLAGEPDALVIALDSRRTEVQTQQRQAPGESGHRRRRGPLFAAAVFTAVIAVVGVVLLLSSATDDGQGVVATTAPPPSTTAAPPTVTEEETLMAQFVAALQANDVPAAHRLVAGEFAEDDDFVGWIMALDLSGFEFDCQFASNPVTCDTTSGPGYFYERIHGEAISGVFAAEVTNGELDRVTWPPGTPTLSAEQAFRTWARQTHPAESEIMFDDSVLLMDFTVRSGELRMELLDEFLASLESEALVDEFVAALRDRDAAAAMVLVGEDPAEDGFLNWLTVLDTSGLEFFDCTYEPDRVRCTTTMGPDFWYERIHGENAEMLFIARVEAGTLNVLQWMAPIADQFANGAFKSWVTENHPELLDVIFDATPIGKLTRVAAEARVELLEEYLSSL